MAIMTEFDRVIKEHMDLSDRNTRKTIISLDDADQNQLLAALTSKLYDKIVEKVDDIDFGTIPRSRGDITKIENYASLIECVDIMRGIVVEYKENTYPIDVVSSAIENMKQRTKTFMKAYTLNVELPIVLYNTITLAIVSSVSYLISGCIEYIKDPDSETFTIALDKVGYNKTAQNLLFENLSAFNNACKKGDIDLAMEDCIRNNKKLSEAAEVKVKDGKNFHPDMDEEDNSKEAINDSTKKLNEAIDDDYGVMNPVFWTGKALIAIAKLIIPILQNLVYYFYQSRQDVSDYFAIQAELVQMNAYKVQYNTDIEASKRKTIYNKQMKMADHLKKVSNFFAINYNKSAKSAAALANDEKKKFKSEELGMAPPVVEEPGQSSLF